MVYEHTQHAKWVLYLSIGLGLYFLFIVIITHFQILSFLLFIIVVILPLLFNSLTVTVDSKIIHIQFGFISLFRKNFLLLDIASVSVVYNKWYYGWGIRYLPFRNIWIYNLSGLNAVEIVLKNGSVRRIGTNEPRKLRTAIIKHLK